MWKLRRIPLLIGLRAACRDLGAALLLLLGLAACAAGDGGLAVSPAALRLGPADDAPLDRRDRQHLPERPGPVLLRLIVPIAQGVPLACAERAALLRELRTRYGEVPVARALAQDGRMIEVLANIETGTFSIVKTTPAGLSCPADAGEAWQALPAPPVGRAS